MIYHSLEACINDLEKNGHLIRIKDEVDPTLEMSAIHLHMFSKKGPAILFEKVKGSPYRAVSNLFGTVERSQFMFRHTFEKVQTLVQLRNNPMAAIKQPFKYASTGFAALKALPRRGSLKGFDEIKISDLPLIKHWPMDGGAFVTLPQVYSEDCDQPGVMQSNLGMYRIQLDGNEYVKDKEIGLHYQLHRGIGVHQTKSNARNQPLKVSVFIGGPPAHTLAAVMPLPEGISELTFAGVLAGKRFRYAYHEGHCISLDADFVITGEVYPHENKPEGPFGDHLGYYSLTHPFPLMRVHKVYAKRDAIWPFTVVGRPPQEDTAFGALIHEISGSAIPSEIPGVTAVHAVDESGVHPLLLANGSERYTPYLSQNRPAELLTQASRILGTGQLSLAKYLYIAAGENMPDCHHVAEYFKYVFERIDLMRDLHFQTKTTIDTLDYSGSSLNEGSKLVLAACGPKRRELAQVLPDSASTLPHVNHAQWVMPGVIALCIPPYLQEEEAQTTVHNICVAIKARHDWEGIVQVVLIDSPMRAENLLGDYLWMTYTRSNPAHDVHGVDAFTEQKHWGCKGAMVIDARKKPHHAPELEVSEATKQAIARFFKPGAALANWA